MVHADLLEPIIHSTRLPELLAELDQYWRDEQRRRNEFYEYITPKDKAEYIDGDIIMHSPVSYAHNRVGKSLIRIIENFLYDNKDQGYLGYEKILCRFMRNDYEPDLCYFSAEKTEGFKANQNIFPVPDFIIEILSPSTEKNDRGVKYSDYAIHGVKEYWIIDPITNTIEQYLLDNQSYILHIKTSDGEIQSKVLEGLTINLSSIFS